MDKNVVRMVNKGKQDHGQNVQDMKKIFQENPHFLIAENQMQKLNRTEGNRGTQTTKYISRQILCLFFEMSMLSFPLFLFK